MSEATVAAFWSQVQQTPELQEDVLRALGDTKTPWQALATVATQHGFLVNAAELEATVQAHLKDGQATGELSDEELHTVAGGSAGYSETPVSAAVMRALLDGPVPQNSQMPLINQFTMSPACRMPLP